MDLLLCCCHDVVALLLKLPCPLCGDLTTLILLEFLDRKHSNITFPDRVCGFCCCVVVALLLRCCWRSPTGVRGFGDIFVAKLKQANTSSTTLPHRVYGRCCCVVVVVVVDTLEASPTAMR